jgi:uncharacterized protein YycO
VKWQDVAVLPQAMLDAFVHEIEKLAAPVLEDRKELEKVLRPGDILYTRPKKIDKLHHKVFYAIESRIQGNPHTHVGLYAGNGKVIDAGAWTKGDDSSMAVHKVPLKKFTDRYQFKVLRVDAPVSVKKDAVEFAEGQVGKTFNTRGMLRLVLPFKGKAGKKDRERQAEADGFFCSELIANAYHDLGLAKDKKLKHIMPGDIARSRLTKTVAEFR